MRHSKVWTLAFGLPFFFTNAAWSAKSVFESEGQKFKVETVTNQKDVVWGFDFLPGGSILFTERGGILNLMEGESKKIWVLHETPKVWARGQGGLLDVRVHPTKKNKIYFTYSKPVGKAATTALAIATLNGKKLQDVKTVFTGFEPNTNEIHFGSRIEFDGKGHVFITMGERDQRLRAQSLVYHQGKVLRLNEDGSVPDDNPFRAKKDARPEIWSYGHRNPQGLAFRPGTDELWEAEFGPRGGDELNLIQPGKNYGWPEATYGREYYGPKIGEESKEGTEQPIGHWTPSISPSALAFYSGKAFPKWNGNAFLACLSGTHLRRLVMENNKVVKQEELLKEIGARFRNVRQGPDGLLYVSTDDGRILRLVPVK